MKIPPKIRAKLTDNPFMGRCIYTDHGAPNKNCAGRIEWEHSFVYAGKQINEIWAIVPCCTNHNRTSAMDKDYNRYRALIRAQELGMWGEVKYKYPRTNWEQLYKYLSEKYGVK